MMSERGSLFCLFAFVLFFFLLFFWGRRDVRKSESPAWGERGFLMGMKPGGSFRNETRQPSKRFSLPKKRKRKPRAFARGFPN
ncbi:hypothetical protein AB7M42_004599 [Bradyrhizobium diazoefficiens]|nr:hypothetical protein AAV28_19140 [Bradyrhizobium diazoefficiens USDA 110]PDT58750.1 hypothetical protein CO678_26345 [Bradyrhizobium diazoefficiens]QBP23173.1 hypothetical protein Bdiaspc4_22910 [Bradyrhizobium diazoefficiens]